MENIVFLNGEFVKKSEAKISAFDHGFLFGDGVYETLLVMHGKILDFDAHFSRLQNSCDILGLQFPEYLLTPEKIFFKMQELVKKNSFERGRLRITISRGENDFDFITCPTPTVLMSISALSEYPEKFFREGISIQTILYERSYPEVKSVNFLASLMGRREISKTGNYEGIFVTPEKIDISSGKISGKYFREGTVSNIIVIGEIFDISQKRREKFFWKAPEKTILAGTMQEKIQKKFLEAGFEVSEKNFSLLDLLELQAKKNVQIEVYITNSLFGVLPVQKIDGEFLESSTKNFPLFHAYIGEKFLDSL